MQTINDFYEELQGEMRWVNYPNIDEGGNE